MPCRVSIGLPIEPVSDTFATAAGTSGGASSGDNRSVGDIVGDIARDLSNLVKQEMQLATTEIKQEVAKAGKGAGFLGGAGVAGHLALISLTFTAIWLLDNWMPVELAALILTVVWGIVAAVLAQRGKKEMQSVDPKLETTQRTLKEDVQWAKEQKSS